MAINEDGAIADELFLANGILIITEYMGRRECSPFTRLVRAKGEEEAVRKVEAHYYNPDPYGRSVYADVHEVLGVID